MRVAWGLFTFTKCNEGEFRGNLEVCSGSHYVFEFIAPNTCDSDPLWTLRQMGDLKLPPSALLD